ncbi:hypothetical protein PM082_000488 [Marasmius tenuissimus]|nr:hypothetical protein PM082_000488 [Marasmius tenuissimus]
MGHSHHIATTSPSFLQLDVIEIASSTWEECYSSVHVGIHRPLVFSWFHASVVVITRDFDPSVAFPDSTSRNPGSNPGSTSKEYGVLDQCQRTFFCFVNLSIYQVRIH